jgi:prevent-host-death family protein
MVTMNATTARNNIKKLWTTAASEPVTIESAGKPIAVVLSPEEYERLKGEPKPRKLGFAKDLLKGIDVDALLATTIDDVFAEYM